MIRLSRKPHVAEREELNADEEDRKPPNRSPITRYHNPGQEQTINCHDWRVHGDEARAEAERSLAAIEGAAPDGVPVIGLEPSCIFSFRDEIPALLKGERANRIAARAMLFEEFLAREAVAGRLALPIAPLPKRALLHGHCHQKSFGAMTDITATLRLVPQLEVETIESSCCGMAGSFGYQADTIGVSLAMGELSLLPAVRRAAPDAVIIADGTSCRHQIHDGTGREAIHVARLLAEQIADTS